MPYAKILPKTESPLKYNFDELFAEKLPFSFRQSTFLKYLEVHGIVKATFYKDKAILLTDKQSIPEFRLRLYALALDTDIEALCNYNIDQEPVVQLHNRANKTKKQLRKKEAGQSFKFKI